MVYRPLVIQKSVVTSSALRQISRYKIFLFLFFSFSRFASWAQEDVYSYHSTVFSDGSRYEGNWKGIHRHGYGVQVWPNGSRYEGWWLNDQKQGEGLFVWPNGTSYHGNWYKNWPGDHLQNPNIFAMYNLDEIKERFSRIEISKHGFILESMDDPNNAFGADSQEYELLSEGLALKGIHSQIIRYSSADDLKQKLSRRYEEKIDLIWLRAHGANNGASFNCGKDVGTAEFLADLLDNRLSDSAIIVLDSCDTGVPNGLAEQLRTILCWRGINPHIIAPQNGIAYSGFDMASTEFVVLMIDPVTGLNVAKTFVC